MTMLGRGAAPVFNAAVSAAAAVAAAFFTFAMPDPLVLGLADAVGLSTLASAPILAGFARAATMVVAATFAFFLAWSVLGRFDRRTSEQTPTGDEAESVTPRLRRADVHPDAPARRPILARKELGEPLEAASPAAIEQAPANVPADAPAASSDERSREAELFLPPQNEVKIPLAPMPQDAREAISSLFLRLNAEVESYEWPLRSATKQEEPAQVRDEVEEQLQIALDDLRKMAGGR
jgi:hypothetical protein